MMDCVVRHESITNKLHNFHIYNISIGLCALISQDLVDICLDIIFYFLCFS